ncbi:dethiobiotin synthase [Cesiribacter andamanensis]|uniref:ATP-dependent dethiobiotin synthetase BioD n=1 Tax=Cesiribacter andamanensis AMV16 TaxID=1279009 RepID=M7NT17_9BACT|nr:dethiobiotin synthase [Cesiribacter andamanensis]EMR04815.1 ATP-dependent dethiobiotin synthetase BioD 1 [Cesiribacter andamanensis AMV16]
MRPYFVTAIGTDSGKTLVSALLCRALGAEYWKPIQCGIPADAATIRQLNPQTRVHPEAYFLQLPASPHAAARAEGVQLDARSLQLPATDASLVIEGAGGMLVPLNDREFIIDLVPHFGAEVVLVANLYLGSINHTLLSWQLLQQRGYPVRGIIFNGTPNPESEQIILHHTGYKKLLSIDQHEQLTPHLLEQYAATLRTQLG